MVIKWQSPTSRAFEFAFETVDSCQRLSSLIWWCSSLDLVVVAIAVAVVVKVFRNRRGGFEEKVSGIML